MNKIEMQYRTAENLNIRMAIHARYSTNPQPFGDWIMSHYAFGPRARILELGCGTGDMWKGKLPMLNDGARLTLTDLSPGMLDAAKQNIGEAPCVEYGLADIQNIPYEENAFDAVIANMMLYHVPDLNRGIAEVRRVLKPGGTFYCATYGEQGIMAYIHDTLREYGISGRIGKTFTLQNGGCALGRHFAVVDRHVREDGLAVTHIPDFVDYVLSLSSLSGMENADAQLLLQAFERKAVGGVLHIPKEYGMFICR